MAFGCRPGAVVVRRGGIKYGRGRGDWLQAALGCWGQFSIRRRWAVLEEEGKSEVSLRDYDEWMFLVMNTKEKERKNE